MNTNGATVTVIGVDPGATTGMLMLNVRGRAIVGWTALQVQNGGTATVLQALLDNAVTRPRVAIEAFTTGASRRGGRSSHDGRATADLAKELVDIAAHNGAQVALRPAGSVKPWATDARLAAAGLDIKRMAHARDAARHALFEAVRNGLLVDPLEGTL